MKTPIAREHKASNGSGAVFLRLGEPNSPPKFGVFLALQNPFLKWERKDGQVAMAYSPDMEWRAAYGPFESDRVCLGLYELTGVEFPARNLREWQYVREPERAFANHPLLDMAEFDAVTRCVDAFVLYRPQKSLRVHVPWCENDYQIDVAKPEGRAEWKRILDQCAAVGVEHSLFTPANSDVAPLKDNADAWGWECCLWLGLGQKIRKGEWNIASDPIPPSIQEILDYAKSKNVKLVAYAYPTLGWKQNPEWTAWCGGKTGGYIGADTGVRSFQDWFVEQLVAFQKRTGISGYSFDHWWIAYEPTKEGFKPTSKYAQWYGCRRILEELRRRIPDVVVDGRQQYQWFGPWTWLGGSYPHPTTNDEQPGSFENFPDLHFSRVSGDRQRWATWYYHMEQFTPWEVVPGYMTHQTPRSDPKGHCVRDRAFHVRDWDYLGWRYSVISSIGTAPFNHVVDYLPARDEAEFKHFRPEDQRWLRQWMDWTDEHRATLRHLRPIIGPPALGRVDGTAAIHGDRGFVFLFNPNYRTLDAQFTLDASIGLTSGDRFVLREFYPRRGRLLGQPESGPLRRGDKVSLPIKGPEAMVLEVVPAAAVQLPALLGAAGQAALDGESLTLTSVEGEPGTTAALTVLLPPGKKVASLRVNGRPWTSFAQSDGRLTLDRAVRRRPFRSLPADRQLRSRLLGHRFPFGVHDPAAGLRSVSRPPPSLADSLHGRRPAGHMARPAPPVAVRPHRRPGRQVDGGPDAERPAGRTEEGLRRRVSARPRTDLRRLLRRRLEPETRHTVHRRSHPARRPPAGPVPGPVLRERRGGVHDRTGDAGPLSGDRHEKRVRRVSMRNPIAEKLYDDIPIAIARVGHDPVLATGGCRSVQ